MPSLCWERPLPWDGFLSWHGSAAEQIPRAPLFSTSEPQIWASDLTPRVGKFAHHSLCSSAAVPLSRSWVITRVTSCSGLLKTREFAGTQTLF